MIEINAGDQFGRLTVISSVFKRNNIRMVRCRCECGTEKDIAISPLFRGITVSCGCYGKEARKKSMREKADSERKNKNEYKILDNNQVEMHCSNREHDVFIFDYDDLPFALKHTWKINKGGYVSTSGDHRILFHREVIGALPDDIVDHINLNKLDNRKANLRICKQRENCYNKPPNQTKNSSKYKGVFRARGNKNFFAQIGYLNKMIYIGTFENEIDAAKAYDEKAKELFGEYAYLNFPTNGNI